MNRPLRPGLGGSPLREPRKSLIDGITIGAEIQKATLCKTEPSRADATVGFDGDLCH